MTQTAEQNHKTFVQRVAETGKVYFLETDEGLALSESSQFEDVGVIPFWSDEASARANAKEGWSDHKVGSIDLPEFLESFIIQFSNDEVLVGTDWDQDMSGKELEPVELALELVDQLNATGKTLALEHHKDLAAYEQATREAWEFIQSQDDDANND